MDRCAVLWHLDISPRFLSIFILAIARFKQCNDVVSSFILITPPFPTSTDSFAGRYLLPRTVAGEMILATGSGWISFDKHAVTSSLRAGFTPQPTATI